MENTVVSPDLNTKEDLELIKQQLEKNGSKIDPGQIAKSLRIAPSKRQILQLPKSLLLKHNALIFHKGSTLPSTQRKLVQSRIAYGIKQGTIQTKEVANEINKLNALIQGELIKATKDNKEEAPE